VRAFLAVTVLTAAVVPTVGVDPAALRRHVELLAADELAGRAVGTAGAERAAAYLAAELAAMGVEPGSGGTYFQPVPMHATSPQPQSELLVELDSGTFTARLGDDYLLFTGGSQTLIPQSVETVFVGYGIVAPEFDYNDYQTLDVANKVVVFVAGEPPSADPSFFAGEQPTVHSTPEAKQRIAISRGARGSLLVVPDDAPAWAWWQEQFAFESVSLAYTVSQELAAVVRSDVAARLFENAATDLDEVLAMHRSGTLRSFPLAARIAFRGVFQERDFTSANVVGVVRGGSRPDEAVLLCAHYDHLGVGPAQDGDRIYNGAIDNAIGVAGVLEIARTVAAGPGPDRTVIVLLSTGEEKGLLGAAYYVDHPVRPLHRTVAAVNVDGLAHLGPFTDVVAIGGDLSSLGRTVARVAARSGLEASPLPPEVATAEAYARSDQLAFAEAGIPAVLVTEGFGSPDLDRAAARARFVRWMATTYHSPRDDARQPIDYAAAARHAGLLLELVRTLAASGNDPYWNPGIPYATTRLQNRIEGR